MSLTKESFEEAQKKARERIAQWVSEAKAAGISRLQDRYDETFTSIEWEKKGAKHKKKSKPKKTKSKGHHDEEKKENKRIMRKNDQKLEDGGVIDRSHNIRNIGHCSPECTHNNQRGRSRTTSRCRSRAKSRQTPERCQSSRQTSERRTGSRKRYRDSASLIFGDNRNNRSSMLNSACSLDAISLLPEANSEIPDKTFRQASKSSKIKVKRKGRGKGKQKSTGHTVPVNILIVDHDDDGSSKIPVKQNRHIYSNPPRYRGEQRKMSLGIFPTDFKKRRRAKDPVSLYEENDFISIALPPSPETTDRSSATTVKSIVKILESDTPLRPETDLGHPKICLPTSLCPATMSTSSRRLDKMLTPKEDSVHKAPSGVLTHALAGIKSSLNLRRAKSGRIRTQHSPPGKTGSKGSSSSPDKELRRKNAIKRFRLLVRKIMCVIAILKTAVKNVKQNLDADKKKARKKSQMLMAFDPTHFSSATTYGDLSKRSRTALEKQPHQRTNADIRILTEVMCRLPFFIKYPYVVKVELARLVWYDCYENGRIIIRQGDIGNRMYFIVSGGVSIHRTDTDPKTDQKIIQHVRDITEGSTFGELALIRNISRNYTAICKGKSEFLSVGKDEFNLVLRNKWEESWQQRLEFLTSSKYFQSWTTDQLKQTADVSNINEYNSNAVVFGDENKLTEYVYFIMKGQCQLVRKLHLVHAESPYLRPVLLLSEKSQLDKKAFLNKPYGKKSRKFGEEVHFVTVMTLHPGDYFGVGENMKDAYILSKTRVECLLLNAASFSIHSKREELINMKHVRENVIPSQTELHKRYEINRRWKEYKQKVVNEVIKNRAIPNYTSYDDVPETIKLEPGVPWNLLD